MGTKPGRGGAKHSLLAWSLLPAAMLAAMLCVTDAGVSRAAGAEGPVVDDWTHHRLVFSDPGTLSDAIRGGRVGEWLHVMNDPRFALQQRKRRAALEGGPRFDEWMKELGQRERLDHEQHHEPKPNEPRANLPRGSISAAEVERVLGVPAAPREENRPRHHPEASGALHTDWSEDMGNNATVGIGNFPAKFSFSLSTANCGSATNPDFVVYNTGVQGEPGPTTGQATVIAYDNLYSGCSGTAPVVYWAYNTGTGSTVSNSVILSLDGTQVAFAQSNGTSATLVILKWLASTSETASSPDTLLPTPASMYRTCSAPCMTTIAFGNGANDSASSAYYDYTTGSDTLYIGDDSGKLHKFTGVFAGTPTEVTSSPWPVTVSSQALSSPILDGATGRIFVGDYSPDFFTNSLGSPCGTIGCGKIYSVMVSNGSLVGTSGTLDSQFGVVDSPLVDETAGMLYAFAGADVSSSCGGPCSAVYQLAAGFASGKGTEAQLGAGIAWLLSGSFDNAYFSSANPGSPTGHIYVSGDTGLVNNTLYQVTITSNGLSTTAVAGPELADNYTASGNGQFGFGVTEIASGGHDFIFVSVQNYGLPSGCAGGGCVIGYDVSGTFGTSMTPAFATPEAGGTSGIIVDNTSSFSGASQIYFTPLSNQSCAGPPAAGTGGCAIQTSQ
jgi:hypothetical protein